MKINLNIELKRVQYTIPEPILKYFTDILKFNTKEIIKFIQFITQEHIKEFEKNKSVKSLLDNYIMDFIISQQFDINKEINKKLREVSANYNKIYDYKILDIKQSDKLRNKIEKFNNNKKQELVKFTKFTVKIIQENIDLEELTKSYKEEKKYMDYERKYFEIDKAINERNIQNQEEELKFTQEETERVHNQNEEYVKHSNEYLNELNEDITALEAKKQQLIKETNELTLNLNQRRKNVK